MPRSLRLGPGDEVDTLSNLKLHLEFFKIHMRLMRPLLAVIRNKDESQDVIESRTQGIFRRQADELQDLAERSRLGQQSAWRHLFRSQIYAMAARTLATMPGPSAKEPEIEFRCIAGLLERAIADWELGVAMRKGKRRWLSGLIDPAIKVQGALLHSDLALAYLRCPGDFAQNVERGLAQQKKALEIAGVDVAPEVCGAISARFAGLLLAYPTEQKHTYASRAADALTFAIESLSEWEHAVRQLNEWQNTRISAIRILPRAIGMGAPLLWKGAWRGAGPMVREIADTAHELRWMLGIAYRDLGQYEQAIEQFECALGLVSGPEVTQLLIDCGLVYLEMPGGNRLQNLVTASKYFFQAYEHDPESVQGAVALTRCDEALLDAEALQASEEERKQALEDNTDWIAASILGGAEVKRQALAAAAADLRDAFDALQSEGVTALAGHAAQQRGRAHLLLDEAAEAYSAFMAASQVAESLRAQARTVRMKWYLVGAHGTLHDMLVQAALECLLRGQDLSAASADPSGIARAAFLSTERSRTRFLQDQVASCNCLPHAADSAEALGDLFTLRRQWVQAELGTLQGRMRPEPVATESEKVRQAFEAQYLSELARVRERFHDPAYDPDRPVNACEYREIASAVDRLSSAAPTALVEFHVLERGIATFTVLPGWDRPACAEAGIDTAELKYVQQRWSLGWRLFSGPGAQLPPAQWERGYLLPLTKVLKQVFQAPLAAIEDWEKEHHSRIERVILAPHRFLHLLPLHAVPLPDGQLLCDRFWVSYTPSASILCSILSRDAAIPAGDRPTCLATAYSPESGPRALAFNTLEARTVAEALGGAALVGVDALPDRIVQESRAATYLHFACHGYTDPELPLNSGLDLAPEPGQTCARLTLGRIIEQMDLSRAAVVVLSACDSGIPKIEAIRDEYLGLPAGFLLAGAQAVVSTLWPIADLPTWLVMARFVRELAEQRNVGEALSAAVQHVRHLTTEDIRAFTHEAAERENMAFQEQVKSRLQLLPPRIRPFEGMHWWAGFIVSGLPTAQVIRKEMHLPQKEHFAIAA